MMFVDYELVTINCVIFVLIQFGMCLNVRTKSDLTTFPVISDFFGSFGDSILTNTLAYIQDPVTQELCNLKTDELITYYGYIPEVHNITTDDGYILTVFRCNSKKKLTNKKKVVILQHGLLSSSDDFCVNVPNQALAYVMADAGYDVWIQNNRGNFYSRQHISKDPDDPASGFWDFSWDDIALFDYPALYDYVRSNINTSKLYVIGHSQGTTATMALLSLKPEFNEYMHAVSYLSPVGYLSHARIPWSAFALFIPTLETFRNTESLPRPVKLNTVLATYCVNDRLNLCNNLVDFLFGQSDNQRNDTMLPSFFCHFPSGASFDQTLHYLKELQYGYFGRKMTGSKIPPDFELSRISVPTALHYSTADTFTDPRDINRLITQLNNTNDLYIQVIDQVGFGHLDFVWGVYTNQLIYSEILKFFEKHQ